MSNPLKSALLKLTLFALAAGGGCLAAARAARSASHDGKSSNAQMAMPQPGPEMEKLHFLIGSWDWDAEYVKSPMMPEGQKQKGWYKAQLGPGGFSIIADFEADAADHNEIGHEVLTWDPKKKAYDAITVGNGFPGAVIGASHWEGDTLVTESQFETGGQTMHLRSTYSKIQANSVHMEDSVQMGDGTYTLIWKGEATRK